MGESECLFAGCYIWRFVIAFFVALFSDILGESTMKTIFRTALLVIVVLSLVAVPVAAKGPPVKVPICHIKNNGTIQLIEVNEKQLPNHLAHGDFYPGPNGCEVFINLNELADQPSSASTYTVTGARFGLFAGQTIVGGTGISGQPTGPLTIVANPQSLYRRTPEGQHGLSSATSNQGPISVLLDNPASSISFSMGATTAGSSVTIDFFAADGSLIYTTNQTLSGGPGGSDGYNNYRFSGFGIFKGFTVYNNNDPAGFSYYNFAP